MSDEPLHRMDERNLPAVLEILAAAGGTRRTGESWRQDAMTALCLGSAAAPAAVMPMACRKLQVAPGRVLSAGWVSSNQFASRMGLRRQTRNTANRWPDLLPEFDALVVVRREDSGLAGMGAGGAARWYARVGFHEILAIRCLYLDMTEPPAGNANRYAMKVIGPEAVGEWSAQMHQVHREVFANYGGIVQRHEHFWAPALAHHFYRQHYQFQIIGLWSGSGGGGGGEQLVGYAVVGWSGWHSKRPRMDILELATRQWDTAVAQELIRTTCQLAWSKNVSQVRAVVSVHDPYRPYLSRVGFMDRWGYRMLAKWLHPQRYLNQVVAPTIETPAGVALHLSSPGQVPLTIARPGEKARPTHVQTDARMLTRLLLQRVEAASATQEGALVLNDGADASQVSIALPWTPWVFHMLDYI